MIQSARNPDVPIFDPDNPVIIEAKEAQHHQVYQCCWCSAKMYKKVSPNEIPFFALYAGEEHTAPECKRFTKQKAIYSVKETQTDELFHRLLRRPKQRKAQNHSNRSFQQTVPNAPAPENPAIRVLPSYKLKNFIESEDYKLLFPDTIIDNKRADEIFILYRWSKQFRQRKDLTARYPGFDGGRRIIELRPVKPLVDQYGKCFGIKFQHFIRCFDSKYHHWNFVLKFRNKDAELCQQLCNLYFEQTYDSMFRQQIHRRKDVSWVMVAGDWIFDERYNNYTATFTSLNQIYPTTEEELKHMNKEGLGKQND